MVAFAIGSFAILTLLKGTLYKGIDLLSLHVIILMGAYIGMGIMAFLCFSRGNVYSRMIDEIMGKITFKTSNGSKKNMRDLWNEFYKESRGKEGSIIRCFNDIREKHYKFLVILLFIAYLFVLFATMYLPIL